MIEDLDLPDPVIRSHHKNGFIKQYVRDNGNLRTEPATNNVTDYGVGKALENPPELRGELSGIIDRYHDVQQDILESFVDRGQLQTLIQPTIFPPTANGFRVSNSITPDNSRSCTRGARCDTIFTNCVLKVSFNGWTNPDAIV